MKITVNYAPALGREHNVRKAVYVYPKGIQVHFVDKVPQPRYRYFFIPFLTVSAQALRPVYPLLSCKPQPIAKSVVPRNCLAPVRQHCVSIHFTFNRHVLISLYAFYI